MRWHGPSHELGTTRTPFKEGEANIEKSPAAAGIPSRRPTHNVEVGILQKKKLIKSLDRWGRWQTRLGSASIAIGSLTTDS